MHKNRKHGQAKIPNVNKHNNHETSKHRNTKDSTDNKHNDNDKSKHVLKNSTKTNVTDNQPHYQHHNHHQYHPSHDSNKFHHKNGDFLPPSYEKPGNPLLKNFFPNNRHNRRVVNRRKYHKYDKRHFYHISHPTIRQRPTAKVITLDSNWTTYTPSFYNRQNSFDKNHNTEKSTGHYFQNYDSPKGFMDFDDDGSLSQGFNLGGRRYKDFWLL